ncbi:MAG: hypothetical protein JW818_07330 [Pirellulales bacterium]|nr:hypothetical protein [Pirellulales bacterium]
MIDVDFLPAEHRHQHARRHTHFWRVVVLIGFGVLLGGTAVAQHVRRQSVDGQLTVVRTQYDMAQRQRDELTRLQNNHALLADSAALCTYLRHPWPRTQILAAVLNPLPDEITLDELTISREMPKDAKSAGLSSRINLEAEEKRLAALSPAQRDLEKLRDEVDKLETIVKLSGKTTQAAALHRYLGELGRSKLLAKAELNSLSEDDNASEDGEGDMKFTATVTVRPGYGQPNGPVGATVGRDKQTTTTESPTDEHAG